MEQAEPPQEASSPTQTAQETPTKRAGWRAGVSLLLGALVGFYQVPPAIVPDVVITGAALVLAPLLSLALDRSVRRKKLALGIALMPLALLVLFSNFILLVTDVFPLTASTVAASSNPCGEGLLPPPALQLPGSAAVALPILVLAVEPTQAQLSF